MDISPALELVRQELAVAAEAGGDEARALAERLAGPLESAVRLALLDTLAAAAAEITSDLAPGSVELRLRGREPSFVVSPPAVEPDPGVDSVSLAAPPPAPPAGDDGTVARINLRLGEDLKAKVEEAARAAGLSVNTWLVRTVAAAVEPGVGDRRARLSGPRGGDRFTGWVR